MDDAKRCAKVDEHNQKARNIAAGLDADGTPPKEEKKNDGK